MSKDFDQLIKDGEVVKAAYLFAEEGYKNGEFGFTRKQLIEGLAERVQELERKYKEYVSFTESNNYNMDVEFEKLYKQNKHYREELDILGEVINSAPNADKLNEEYERLKGLEGEE